MVKLANEEQSQVKRATRAAYGATLAELANEGLPVVAVDADLTGSTTTKKLADAGFADRLFNCGIAEQNMVGVAAGMSTMGLIPYCSSFAMFAAGRAYEQIRNSIAYPHFNVKICATHAGVSVGEDGGSHQAIEDIGLMRLVPGMTVIVPADAKEARKANHFPLLNLNIDAVKPHTLADVLHLGYHLRIRELISLLVPFKLYRVLSHHQ